MTEPAFTLADITHQQFAARLNQSFLIRFEDDAVLESELVEVSPWGNPSPGQRQPFSLMFRGMGDPVLPQRIYSVENEEMGSLELFLVPIGPDERGMRYEAVFS